MRAPAEWGSIGAAWGIAPSTATVQGYRASAVLGGAIRFGMNLIVIAGDGETLRVGPLALTAIFTPGHTKGHMALHAQNIAMMAGAHGPEVEAVPKDLQIYSTPEPPEGTEAAP